MPQRDCFCEVVKDAWGSVQFVEKCVSCELRDALARPMPDPSDEAATERRLAFESRLRDAASRELAAGRRLA